MKIAKLRNVRTPERGTQLSGGIDFFIPFDAEPIEIKPMSSALIPSGIKAAVPKGHGLFAFNKSGIATKKGLVVGACLVDEDYQGEIHIHLINTSENTVALLPGEKAVQFVLLPILYDSVEIVPESELYQSASERGSGGFGSTNKPSFVVQRGAVIALSEKEGSELKLYEVTQDINLQNPLETAEGMVEIKSFHGSSLKPYNKGGKDV